MPAEWGSLTGRDIMRPGQWIHTCRGGRYVKLPVTTVECQRCGRRRPDNGRRGGGLAYHPEET